MPSPKRRRLSPAQQIELRRHLEHELRRLGPTVPHGRASRILDTLRRLSGPEFGVCTGCGDPITYERLSVMPETSVCVRCSRHRERTFSP
jgi:RNA polymerase-binding transcription factor DksA